MRSDVHLSVIKAKHFLLCICIYFLLNNFPIYILRSGVQDDDFNQRIKKFVATKADLLFSMEGKQKLQRGVDFGLHSNQEGKCT